MPEGNRKRVSKTGLIIAASVAAVVFILGLVAVGFVNQASYYDDAANKDRQFAEYAKHEIGQACRGVVASQLTNCLTKARIEADAEKRAYEHDQADLIAQRKAALWAEMMGLAALLGMGLSIVGVALVYVTFRATRDGNEIQKRIGEAQTRAYISFIDAKCFLSEDNVPHFGFTIKNSGQSPALNMRLQIEATFQKVLKGHEPETFVAMCHLGGIYSVSATDILPIPPRGVGPPPANFMEGFVQCLVEFRCEWDDVFEIRRPDRQIFAFLLEEWPEGPFQLLTYHDYLVMIENDRMRRNVQAKAEGDK